MYQDPDGFYHLPIDTNNWQTLKRLDGYLYRDGEGVNVIKCGWSSPCTWDWDGNEIPIVNSASYSRYDGSVSTMIAPVLSMRFDTITILVGWYDNWKYETVEGEPIFIILD